MEIFSINGTAIPAPDDVGFEANDISKAERNSLGTMIIEKITTKYKFSLKYSILGEDDLSLLLNLMDTVPFDVEYSDPKTKQRKTGSFYPGTRSFSLLHILDGKPRYKDMSVNIIER